MGLTALRRYWRERGDEPAVARLTTTPLPEDFPARAKLVAAGLTTLEDLQANLENLRSLGLTRKEAEAVKAALGE